MRQLSFYILFLLSLNVFISNCKSAPPLKESSSREGESTLSPEDRAKLKKAKLVLNKGNELFQKEKFEDAKKIAAESIEIFPSAEGYYLLGSCQFRLGNHKEAKISYEEGIKISPKLEQLLLTYALTLTTLGEEDKALEVYKNLEEYYPKDKLYSFKAGVILKSLKKYEEAYETLKKADGGGFKQPLQLYMQLGDTALQLKKYEEADAYFDKAKGLDPKYKSANESQSATRLAKLFEKGNEAVRSKDYDSAIKYFRDAVSISPSTAAPYIFLGNVILLKEKYKEAEGAFSKALANDARNVDAYSSLGLVYSKLEKHKQSISILKKGLELFPGDSSLHNRLGLSYKTKGDGKQAIVSFSRAKELDPKNVQPRLNLGYTLIEEGKFGEARKEFIEASKLPGGEKAKDSLALVEASLLIEKGDKLLRTGKTEEALVFYKKAKALRPKEPSVSNAFGRAHFIAKKYSESESSFKESLSKDKNNIPAIQGLIRLYSAQNRKEAKALTDQLVSLTKDDPLAGILVGRIYEDKKEFGKAEDLYKSILSKNPENEAVLFRLGILYHKMAVEKNLKEDYDSALNLVEKARKTNPEIPELVETERVIKENKKFGDILPLVKKANAAFDSKKYRDALENYSTAYKKLTKASLLIKIAECHIALGEEEKGMFILQDAVNSGKEGKLEIKEAIYAFFLKKGQTEKAEEGFQEILKTRPDSYYSNYELGLINLKRKKSEESLIYLNKTIFFNPDFAPAYIARGIIYYRNGDKNRAKEEFTEAGAKDSGLELGPYNLGIMFFNDNLFDEATKIFRELTEKFPEFPDSYYHLSYLFYKKDDLENAEKFIKKAVRLERSATNLYGYIRILEAKNAKSGDQEDKELQNSLAKELAEKFPDSEYAKLAESRLLKTSPEAVIVQKYPLSGKPETTPIFINGKIIVNYGTSLSAINASNKSTSWRVELKEPYQFLGVYTRLYALSKNSLDQLDIQTGKKIHGIPLGKINPTGLFAGDGIFISFVRGEKQFIQSYSFDGEKTGEIKIDKNAVWTKAQDGNIAVFTDLGRNIQWALYDAKLNTLAETPKKIADSSSGKITDLIAAKNALFLIKNRQIHEFSTNGSYRKNALLDEEIIAYEVQEDDVILTCKDAIYKISAGQTKVEKIALPDKSLSAVSLNGKNRLYVNSDNNVVLAKETGEIVWTQPLQKRGEKTSTTGLYSVIYK
ncbi:MAG: tetratricopeptide repeat protein [Leptospira sp.]|nr:tetratricopeptide repeat protein [Leptospira sp.]